MKKITVKLKPLNDKVFVIKRSEINKFGIELPESLSQDEKTCVAEVVATFEKYTKDGQEVVPNVKKGDTVVITRWAGSQINLPDDMDCGFGHGALFSISQSEIHAKLN